MSRFLTLTQTHLVGHLWRSDKLVADATNYATHNKHKRRISMPSAGFEPATAAVERPHAYALERTVTGIVSVFMYGYELVSL